MNETEILNALTAATTAVNSLHDSVKQTNDNIREVVTNSIAQQESESAVVREEMRIALDATINDISVDALVHTRKIDVDGAINRYYPVVLCNNQSTLFREGTEMEVENNYKRVVIHRTPDELGKPSPEEAFNAGLTIEDGVNWGGCYLEVDCHCGKWGDQNRRGRIYRVTNSYRRMVGAVRDLMISTDSGASSRLVVWLRGGTSYNIATNYPIDDELQIHDDETALLGAEYIDPNKTIIQTYLSSTDDSELTELDNYFINPANFPAEEAVYRRIYHKNMTLVSSDFNSRSNEKMKAWLVNQDTETLMEVIAEGSLITNKPTYTGSLDMQGLTDIANGVDDLAKLRSVFGELLYNPTEVTFSNNIIWHEWLRTPFCRTVMPFTFELIFSDIVDYSKAVDSSTSPEQRLLTEEEIEQILRMGPYNLLGDS